MPAEQHGTSDIVHSTLTRRNAVTGALGAAGLLAVARSAAAQEATPAPDDVSYLFVQACESGVATGANDGERTYELTLRHASGQTLAFTDRPDRFAGIVPTAAVVEEIDAIADDPPNAALAFAPEGASDSVEVAIVELTAPSFDAEVGTVTYRARMVDIGPDQESDAAESEAIEPVTELPASFGQATLFIDGVPGAVNKAIIVVNLSGSSQRIAIYKRPPEEYEPRALEPD